jgi:AbrB family looped-hinge helix DNA binding protein
MVDEVVKVTRKYQVTIPRRVCSKLGIKIGDKPLLGQRGDG